MGGPSHSRGQHGGGHSDTSGDRRERPPPGLRGREIGMWHAARSKRKNREDHDEVGQVTIETGEIGLHFKFICSWLKNMICHFNLVLKLLQLLLIFV